MDGAGDGSGGDYCGTVFCGYFCSFGAVQDFLWFAGNKLKSGFEKQVRKPAFKFKEEWKKCSNRLDQIWCAPVLGSLRMERYDKMEHRRAVAGVWTVQFHRTLAGCEADVFDWRCADSGDFRRIRLNPALFCRYLCPMGAIYSLISRCTLLKIVKPRSKCGSCRLCTANVPWELI